MGNSSSHVLPDVLVHGKILYYVSVDDARSLMHTCKDWYHEVVANRIIQPFGEHIQCIAAVPVSSLLVVAFANKIKIYSLPHFGDPPVSHSNGNQ